MLTTARTLEPRPALYGAMALHVVGSDDFVPHHPIDYDILRTCALHTIRQAHMRTCAQYPVINPMTSRPDPACWMSWMSWMSWMRSTSTKTEPGILSNQETY